MISTRTNKKTAWLAGAALIGTLLLAACGNGENGGENGAGAQAASPSAERTQAEPSGQAQTGQSEQTQNGPSGQTPTGSSESGLRTVEHLMGKTEIPANPQRVVTTQYTEELTALGVRVAGGPQWQLDLLDLLGKSADRAQAADIGAPANLEKIAALSPDLIIGQDAQKDTYDELSKIAPTVLIPWGDENVYERLEKIAAVVGKEQVAKDWISAHEAKAAAAREQIASHIGSDETVAIVVIGGYEKGQLRVYGGRNVGHAIYNDLKLKPTPPIQAEMDKTPTFVSAQISLEKLPDYAAADRLFLLTFDNDPDYVEQVENSALWKNLPAVKNGHVYPIPEDIWFNYDPLSIDRQLDEAVRLLTTEQ